MPLKREKHTTAHLLALIHRDLLRLGKVLERLAPVSRPSIGAFVSGVFPKDGTMAIIPFTLPVALDLAIATAPKDAAGNPTTPTLQWTNSDSGSVLTLEVAPDTLSAKGRVTAPGSSVITISDPVTGASDEIDVTVSADSTVTVNASVSTIAKGA